MSDSFKILASAALLLLALSVPATSKPLRIVAIGASNTHGWYVGNQGAYPARLQTLLQAKGIQADVVNAGVPAETTSAMLRRIDNDVPGGTDIVILQPGGNDRRFLQSNTQRAANIAEIARRLRNRGIKVLVYDEPIPPRHYSFDQIHLTAEGHAAIAANLLPRVMALVGGQSVRNSQPAKPARP